VSDCEKGPVATWVWPNDWTSKCRQNLKMR